MYSRWYFKFLNFAEERKRIEKENSPSIEYHISSATVPSDRSHVPRALETWTMNELALHYIVLGYFSPHLRPSPIYPSIHLTIILGFPFIQWNFYWKEGNIFPNNFSFSFFFFILFFIIIIIIILPGMAWHSYWNGKSSSFPSHHTTPCLSLVTLIYIMYWTWWKNLIINSVHQMKILKHLQLSLKIFHLSPGLAHPRCVLEWQNTFASRTILWF